MQYRIAQPDPLIIERTAQAHADTIAYLEERRNLYVGRTNATRAGFDFTDFEVAGRQYTGLVFFDGFRRATYRCAIEIPGGHLSDPGAYHPPWPWSEVEVFDGPIEAADKHPRKEQKLESAAWHEEVGHGNIDTRRKKRKS